MFDNIHQIRSNYEKSLADYQADRTEALNTLTTASFFGGLGLVLLVAMLGLMRIVSGMHLWIAAIGATTCCLIVGAILMDPGRLATDQGMAVGFSSYFGPTPMYESSQDREPTPTRRRFVNVDDVVQHGHFINPLFWNPLLIAGPDGKASISFMLPDAADTYRVTVDAHGEGRIGSGRAKIVVRGP